MWLVCFYLSFVTVITVVLLLVKLLVVQSFLPLSVLLEFVVAVVMVGIVKRSSLDF